MKKILVPTDFSPTAQNAMLYAIDLANRFGSTITLLHAYATVPVSSSFVDVSVYIKDVIEPKITAQAQATTAALRNGASVETRIVWKSIAEAIKEVTEQELYDLIVMGTKGASGWRDFFGTHTSSVLKNTDLPLFVVPDSFAFRQIKTIVLGVDEIGKFDETTLQPLLTIAKNYGAFLRIYHKDETDDGPNTAIDPFLHGLERTYYYELTTESLYKSMHDFAQELHGDLLCMIRRKRDFLEAIFHDSATFSEVLHSALPLLLLQE